jgi:hypothetical protein
MHQFYEGQSHTFHTISAQAGAAVASLGRRGFDEFLVAADVFEGSRASGRPSGRVVREVEDEDDLFVLDTTVFGGTRRFVCARRGRRVLVAQVVARRREVGRRELEAARAALRDWRRRNRGQRSNARDA